MLHAYVYYHCLLFSVSRNMPSNVLSLFLFPSFMFYVLPMVFFPQLYVICITVGPVQDEVCPGPVHELRGVVWIKGSMIEPAHLFYIHSQSTMKKQTDLVPPCHGPTRVHGGFVD